MKPYDESSLPPSIVAAKERRTQLVRRMRQIEWYELRKYSSHDPEGYRKKGILLAEKVSIEAQLGFLRNWIKSEKQRLESLGISHGVMSGHPLSFLSAARDIIVRLEKSGAKLEESEKHILSTINDYLAH